MTPDQRRRFRLDRLFRSSRGRNVALAGILGLGGAHAGGLLTDEGPAAEPPQPEYEDPVAEAVAETMVTRLAGRGWDLPNLEHERVDFWVDRFTNDEKMRARFEGFLVRSGQYVPMLSVKLAERDMPHDLVFLAMIESGFQPAAYSHAHASGLWQFIEETGERYGLRVDETVDERNHPAKATDAALDYLTDLYDRFDSWYLAAAAYNTGENRVGRIMREETGSERAASEADYYRIWDRLPRETRDYVPLMIAAARIAKDPATYGFDHVVPMEPLDIREVEVRPGTTFEEIATRLDIEVDELRAMNPHLPEDRTPADTEYTVVVPGSEAGRLAASDLATPEAEATPTVVAD